MATKVLVTGSRNLTPSDVAMMAIFDLFAEEDKSYQLIHGMCPGADTLAALEAARRGWNVSCDSPDWKRYGYSASYMSMISMTKTNPEIVVGFIKGKSFGVKKCLKLVKKLKSVKIIYLWDEGILHTLTPDKLNAYWKRRYDEKKNQLVENFSQT